MPNQQQLLQLLQLAKGEGNYGTSGSTPFSDVNLANPQFKNRTAPGSLAPGVADATGPLPAAIINLLFGGFVQPFLEKAAKDNGFQIGQIGGGAWDLRDDAVARRQEEQLSNISNAANVLDNKRVSNLISAGLKMANPDVSAAQIKTQTAEYLEMYNTARDIPIIGGAIDQLVPGGTAKGFAEKLARAQFAQTMGGDINPEAINSAVSAFEEKFSRGGRGEDRGFTRGFTRSQMGEMAQSLGAKGLLKLDVAPEQLKEFAGSLSAVRDLIGDPSAPVPTLIDALNKLTGGGVGKMTMTKMNSQIRQLKVLGDDLGISGEALSKFAEGMSIRAEGMGLDRSSGASMATEALSYYKAMKRVTTETSDGGPNPFRMNDTEMARLAQETIIRGKGSEFNKRTSALSYMMDNAGGAFKAAEGATAEQQDTITRLNELIPKANEGTLTREETKELQNLTKGQGIYKIAKAMGVSSSVVKNLMGSDYIVAGQNVKYDKLLGSTVQSQAVELEGVLEKSFRNSSDISKALNDEEIAQLKDIYVNAEGLDDANAKAKDLLESKGIDKTQSMNILASAMSSVNMEQGGYRNIKGKEDTIFNLVNKKTLKEAQAVVAAAEQSGTELEAAEATGKGMTEAGIPGILRQILNTLQESNKDTPLLIALLKSLGAEYVGDKSEFVSTASGRDGTTGLQINAGATDGKFITVGPEALQGEPRDFVSLDSGNTMSKAGKSEAAAKSIHIDPPGKGSKDRVTANVGGTAKIQIMNGNTNSELANGLIQFAPVV